MNLNRIDNDDLLQYIARLRSEIAVLSKQYEFESQDSVKRDLWIAIHKKIADLRAFESF